MALGKASKRELEARKAWEAWWRTLTPAEKAECKRLGVDHYARPDQYHLSQRSGEAQFSALGQECPTGSETIDLNSADRLLIESEFPSDPWRLGDAAALFLSWVFREGPIAPSGEDIMRRLFLVVRFAFPELIERWEEAAVRILIRRGDRYRLARFAFFDARQEKRFRYNLRRRVIRRPSIVAIGKMGLGSVAADFGEVEKLVSFWFAVKKKGRPATPSHVVRRAVNTAYAIRPDLVLGFSKKLLGRLTGQTGQAFHWRDRDMFDPLGIVSAHAWSPEARESLKGALKETREELGSEGSIDFVEEIDREEKMYG